MKPCGTHHFGCECRERELAALKKVEEAGRDVVKWYTPHHVWRPGTIMKDALAELDRVRKGKA